MTLATVGVKVILATIRKRLQKCGLHGRCAWKKALLAKNIIRDQLQFANKHICKDQVCWNNMLGTDKSKIVLFGYSNSKHVWATTKGRFLGEEAQFTREHGSDYVTVWVCSPASRIEQLRHLIRLSESQQRVLKDNVRPSVQKMKWSLQ